MGYPASPSGPTRGLGWRTSLGVPDTPANGGPVNPYLPGTGWDVIFTPDALRVTDTEYECYHIALDGPIGSAVQVLIDGHNWDWADGWVNGWDPSQPMLIKYGQTVQFCWNVAATNPPYDHSSNVQPTVTLWLRRLGALIT